MTAQAPGTNALGTPGQPLRVAVVGSGPGGFYAAEALLACGLAVEVDLIERLPVPYGLVRFGVAPDHAKLKSVTAVFDGIARDPRCRFFGNVALGRELSAEQLAAMYHAVVVAVGADADRKLGIDGEHLAGVHAAGDFVGWYNGKPECAAMCFDLSQDVAVVVGQGNVAIDVCRILAKPVEDLRRTDITQHALDALAASRVREIHLIGRRGPVQARFTPKELRELGTLPGWRPIVDPASLVLNEESRQELALAGFVHASKNCEILHSFAAHSGEAARVLHLHFYQAPVALQGSGRLHSLTLEKQRLAGPAGDQRSVPTGERSSLRAGLLFRSVGYRGCAVPGLPFDTRTGTLSHRDGRVMAAPGTAMKGWYATGWIKRGPTGVIGSNRLDSVETVASLLKDLPALDTPKPGRTALLALLNAMGHRVVTFDNWLAIERAEQERGHALNKVAEKFVRVPDMLVAAAAQPSQPAPA
ncbi:FAD-dependent oxidoreductase [Methylibium sp.]|uniref:FAD-dependent oxidoreductase n=1 Tax=Methylibium sp. TaxID=2067992 RepID=UPI0017D91105|nr:FAD-dependent oxidoreductase [Methylibium sp.]MBA3588241.1 FAD-dependent oxidoreductase [Methylibium sp.]